MKTKKILNLILKILIVTAGLVIGVFILLNLRFFVVNPQALLISFIVIFSILLIIHGIFTLCWMLYAWEDPENVNRHKSPKIFSLPKYSFTALIPARHEENVIEDTIQAVSRINYPEHLKEVLILCRNDDYKTITKVEEVIEKLGKSNIRLVVFNSFPINKPRSLNQGLKQAKNEVIAVFDAEDEPHSDIYNVVNTLMVTENPDIVQSGVQLMNYRSNWFSTLNVLEYFFWFKSALHFFSKLGGVSPLGGNSVFFKKTWLELIGGWDENCLTEDADIGFRLMSAGAKLRVVYDEQHATREESPSDLTSFVKQRTRWDQGFIQVLFKGDWKKLSNLSQKLFAVYILLSPEIQTVLLFYTPVAVWLAFSQKLPILVSLISFIPFFLLLLQVLGFMVGLYEYTKAYNLKFHFWMTLKVLLTFYPYQLILIISAFRALYRVIFSHNGWDKTLHINAHRIMAEELLLTQNAK